MCTLVEREKKCTDNLSWRATVNEFLLFNPQDWVRVRRDTTRPVLYCSFAVLDPRVDYTMDVLSNQRPKVRERIHLFQLFILNEYAARYAVLCYSD